MNITLVLVCISLVLNISLLGDMYRVKKSLRGVQSSVKWLDEHLPEAAAAGKTTDVVDTFLKDTNAFLEDV